MELKGKAALITGGARIGRAVAEALARRGCHVAVTYRTSRSGAEETVESVSALGVKAAAVCVDLRRESDMEKAVPAAEKALGRLDILVNMASRYEKDPLSPLIAGGNPEDLSRPWQANMEVDLRSAYWLSLRAAAPMRRGGGGRIVNFTDWIAASGRPRYKDSLPYYVAKSGVKGLTEALALELAPDILVNAVAPGPILPPDGLPDDEAQEAVRNTPLGRWGGAVEIARTVVFLCETDFITGECVRVDGGRHLF